MLIDLTSFCIGAATVLFGYPVGLYGYRFLTDKKNNTKNLTTLCADIYKFLYNSKHSEDYAYVFGSTEGYELKINTEQVYVKWSLSDRLYVYFNKKHIFTCFSTNNFNHHNSKPSIRWKVEKTPELEAQIHIALTNYYNMINELENEKINKKKSISNQIAESIKLVNETGKLNIANANSGELMLAEKDD